MKDYIVQRERISFKHETSRNLSCDTYSMHTHNQYELIWFLNGDATHVIEDRKYKLKKGDLILIRPFCYHFIQIDSPVDYERYAILFDAERHGVESVELIPDGVDVMNILGNGITEDIFRKCDLYRKNCEGEIFEKLLPHLLSELFYAIHTFPNAVSEERATVSPLISKALQYINDHLFAIDGIGEIARHLFVSESYLFRLFRTEMRQTPKKYIMDKRLLLSQKMILSGEKPTRVCEICGFGDYTSFYRNYSAFFGYPPSEERGRK